MSDSIHILQIGDTHWAKEPIAQGIDPQSRLDSLCNWINSLTAPIDFIVHTGDWVHRGHLAEDQGQTTRIAWERVSQLGIPILSAAGNHDNREALSQCLWRDFPTHWNLHRLDTAPQRLDYWFSINHPSLPQEAFLVLDARASQSIDPRGQFCQEQLAAVERLLSSSDKHWTVFLHYPPIPLDCDWIDQTMLIENGIQLHAILANHSSRIRGVFFGHVHRPVCCSKDSVFYASTGSSTVHFPNMPGDKQAVMQSDPIAFANYIRINPLGALVKTQWTML